MKNYDSVTVNLKWYTLNPLCKSGVIHSRLKEGELVPGRNH